MNIFEFLESGLKTTKVKTTQGLKHPIEDYRNYTNTIKLSFLSRNYIYAKKKLIKDSSNKNAKNKIKPPFFKQKNKNRKKNYICLRSYKTHIDNPKCKNYLNSFLEKNYYKNATNIKKRNHNNKTSIINENSLSINKKLNITSSYLKSNTKKKFMVIKKNIFTKKF